MADNTADLARLRVDYSGLDLDENTVHSDPFEQFRLWFDQVLASGLKEPNAMALATAGPDGAPSCRMVLLKAFDARGFVFFTNYGSSKGREIETNPRAALAFYWAELERQVRVSGSVTRVTPAESDEYFAVRPPLARIGAAASPQSRVIPGRAWLEQAVGTLQGLHPEGDIPRPVEWGGYRVQPASFEFWQGRRNRLHDRILYTRTDEMWKIARLSP
ncbi:pyridoxamine 5'-phosphate oxidase [uncultured Paludibaculum sp.]|uniref:pyridoxamine 5'-phosphate oxidase n=1 Tax=uncultured Paludibaculum sp. TaxID=1765020 RepID=UPI002AAAA1D4|nr:pyridoxamine 5'-phosphate oxidase [uncultured Paludibaculum sp.]